MSSYEFPREASCRWVSALKCEVTKKKKNALYLSVNVFSMKVLIGDTILHYIALYCSAKEVPSFLSHFKTLSVGAAPGIEPMTSHSAVKRSTD